MKKQYLSFSDGLVYFVILRTKTSVKKLKNTHFFKPASEILATEFERLLQLKCGRKLIKENISSSKFVGRVKTAVKRNGDFNDKLVGKS